MTGEKMMVGRKIERNYGIDLLRLVSMFMIVILHVLGRGGVLEATTQFTLRYGLAWFLEIACYCAVNCYALISGYVGIYSKHKWSSVIYLWLQVEFYMILFTTLFAIFQPGSIGIVELLKMLFPVVFYQYWYFTAYFCMFFFIPVLNHVVDTLEKKTLILISSAIFLLFSLVQTLRYAEIFGTGGTTPLWLALLYFIGAVLRKYDLLSRAKKRTYFFIYTACVALTWLSKIGIGTVTSSLMGKPFADDMFVNYISPTMVLAALALLGIFSVIRIKKLIPIIRILSPLAFGVYLAHTNQLIFHRLLDHAFDFVADLTAIRMVGFVLAAALVIYAFSLVLEFIRYKLFNLLRIKELSEKIADCGKKLLDGLYKRFFDNKA